MIKYCSLSSNGAHRTDSSFTWNLEFIHENGRFNFTHKSLVNIVLNFQIRNNMKILCNVIDKSPGNEFGVVCYLHGVTGMSHRSNTVEGNIHS